MATWLDDILAVLIELDRPARLQEIYQAVAKRRESLPPSYEAIIRRNIEQNSSDSDAWNHMRDLFKATSGKGGGIWALKGAPPDGIPGREQRDRPFGVKPSLSELTSPTAVKWAVDECDRLGEDQFLATYGFGKSREYALLERGREYASKAIAGVAFGYQFPNVGPLAAGEFNGGVAPGSAAHVLDQLGFDVSNMQTKRRPGWTLQECEITADAYFHCLRKKLNGESFVRQRAIRDVAALIRRSEGAIDFKFQNIDAILSEAGLPRLNDATAPNIQNLLEYVVLDPLANRFEMVVNTPSTIADSSGEIFVAPPTTAKDQTFNHGPRLFTGVAKVDFAEIEEKNRKLGRLGEQFVLRIERERLSGCGRADLANRIKWVSDEIGDGLGYDIESFDTDGNVMFIEVKTTNQDCHAPFFITANELIAASRFGERYRLYRVFNLSTDPQVYVLVGPLEPSLSLTAKVYTAIPAVRADRQAQTGSVKHDPVHLRSAEFRSTL